MSGTFDDGQALVRPALSRGTLAEGNAKSSSRILRPCAGSGPPLLRRHEGHPGGRQRQELRSTPGALLKAFRDGTRLNVQ